MKITKVPQHYIDWDSVGGYKKFMADYNNAPTYNDKRLIIDSLPLQTNPDWLDARRAHITASKMKDFLGMDRTGKNPGVSYKNVVKKLVAEQFGWSEPEPTWSEKSVIKRGLAFEKRARELFTEKTGIQLKNDIGFVSEEIDGLPFGCSPDAYALDENGKFLCICEIKSFELIHIQSEIELLNTPEICEQMQAQMLICDCPRCYKILYCAELDKIFYIKYTRGLDFKKRLLERIPVAKKYREEMCYNLTTYEDLTEKVLAE